MSKPVDLQAEREKRAERCPWCGALEHPEPLMCPRIEYVVMYADEDSVEIHFWPEYDDDEPTAA